MILFCLVFAFIGYAHGMELFSPKIPTIVNRMVCVTALSGLTALVGHNPWLFVCGFLGFSLWIWPGWMSQVSNAIGDNPKCPRWYGTLQMTVRQALIIPCLLGVYGMEKHALWPILGVLLMGLPYLICGYLLTGALRLFVVVIPHAIVATIIGGMIWLLIQ